MGEGWVGAKEHPLSLILKHVLFTNLWIGLIWILKFYILLFQMYSEEPELSVSGSSEGVDVYTCITGIGAEILLWLSNYLWGSCSFPPIGVWLHQESPQTTGRCCCWWTGCWEGNQPKEQTTPVVSSYLSPQSLQTKHTQSITIYLSLVKYLYILSQMFSNIGKSNLMWLPWSV